MTLHQLQMLLPLHPFLPLSSGGKMLRACVKTCKAYFRRKHDLQIFTLVRTYFNPSGWCSEACIVFEMAFLPPQTQCSVKNYCAVVKLALQNASRLVFRRACFTGSQRQKKAYDANDAFATPALYVFLPIRTPLGIEERNSYLREWWACAHRCGVFSACP